MNDKKPPINMRRFRQESDRRLLLLVILTLLVVGGGLIAVILGPEAFLTALPCLLGGIGLILVPWMLLTGAEKLRDRLDETKGDFS
jgi:hypothetical protein